jgi:hypothetical protein
MALMAAFIPGASPPDVRTPILEDPGVFSFIAEVYLYSITLQC